MSFELPPEPTLERKTLAEKKPGLLSEGERFAIGRRVEESEKRRLVNGMPISEERKDLYKGTKEMFSRKVVILTLSIAAGIGVVAEKMDTTQDTIEQSQQLSVQYDALKSELLQCFPKGTQACYKTIDEMDNFFVKNKLDDSSRRHALSALRAITPILLYPN